MSPASSVSSSDTAVDEPSHQSYSRLGMISPRRAVSALTQSVYSLILALVQIGYNIYQSIVSLIFTVPYEPTPPDCKPLGRIAIIGAGLTGIASAAHLVAHGFDVVIYDAEDSVGGIWARVNSTSSLQLNSLMFRFHPRVKWSRAFPERDEILGQIKMLSDKYHLGPKTRLNTKVEKVTRHKSSTDPREGGHARWLVNEGGDGVFDGVIVAIGTCGKPKFLKIAGSDRFKGKILHSSQLDDAQLEGKRVVIIGSGASGVEAAELAVSKHAKSATIIARTDKWIIPRNTLFDILLAMQPFGRQTPTSFLPEWFIRVFHYRDLNSLSPAPKQQGLFEGTPIVNDAFLHHVREGKSFYIRGDTEELTADGVKIKERERGTKPGDEGRETTVPADVIVLATGFERPSIEMLPKDLFPEEKTGRSYARPNLYLQNFATEDCSVLLTNSSYEQGIGTVGNWHIDAMKLWVDLLTWIKFTAWGSNANALAFFTYLELVLLPFVLFGWGVRPSSDPSKLKRA